MQQGNRAPRGMLPLRVSSLTVLGGGMKKFLQTYAAVECFESCMDFIAQYHVQYQVGMSRSGIAPGIELETEKASSARGRRRYLKDSLVLSVRPSTSASLSPAASARDSLAISIPLALLADRSASAMASSPPRVFFLRGHMLGSAISWNRGSTQRSSNQR